MTEHGYFSREGSFGGGLIGGGGCGCNLKYETTQLQKN